MKYAPIIIPTLNRYEHFKECVESLAKNTHADKTELVIGLDYPPSEKYVDGWKKIKGYIPTIQGFGKITVFEHEKNLGPGENTLFIKTYALEKYGIYIFTEDDNIFSPCFLDYMDKCLELFKNDNSVMAICSYIKRNEYPENQNANTLIKISGAFNGWGYGSWKDRVEYYSEKIDFDYRKTVCNDRRILRALKRPEQFANFLDWLEKKSLNSPCDITYAMTNLLDNKSVIYPTSYIGKNNGFDDSGVNCTSQDLIYHNDREIITDTTYVVTFKESYLDKKNTSFFGNVQNKNLPIKEKTYIRLLTICYFFLGYNRTNKHKVFLRKLNKLFFLIISLGKIK